jgi:hypothetical protein
MLKRRAATGLLLGLAALILTLVATASAYKYKKPAGRDCGKVTFTGGFGGPLPSNVPKTAVPQIHTFIIRGNISCTSAKHVMASFEMTINTPAGGGKGISPAGWKCGYNKKVSGQECTNSAHVAISNGIVYKVPKKAKRKRAKH